MDCVRQQMENELWDTEWLTHKYYVNIVQENLPEELNQNQIWEGYIDWALNFLEKQKEEMYE